MMSAPPDSSLRAWLLVGLLVLMPSRAAAQEKARTTRSVASFTKIEYDIPGTLHLRQGAEHAVEIEAPKQVLDAVETTVDGATLEITNADDGGFLGRLFNEDDLDTDQIGVYVTMPTLEALSLAGAGRVKGETRVESPSLSLKLAGSGDVTLTLETQQLSVRVVGAGTCTLRGKARSTDVDIAGSGDVDAGQLTASRGDVRIAGSGNATVNVSDHLSVQILGSGDVEYRGRPTLKAETLGSGNVTSIK